MANLDPGAAELIKICGGIGRGWMNFWGGPQLPPIWFASGNPPKTYPQYWTAVYFSLSPRVTRLTGRRRGGLDDLLYLTTLYSELDEKDGRSWADIENLDPQPSAIVRSGGGWHCYWFVHPVELTNENRQDVNRIQHGWTHFTGGDPGAPDISRVLRLPGSWNCKYNPPRLVELLYLAPDLRYDLRDLAGLIPPEDPAGGMVSSDARAVPAGQQAYTFDPEFWLNKAASMAAPGNRNRVGFWLAVQLRDNGASQAQALEVLERYQAQVTTARDPYTRQEAKDAVRSAYRTAAREPAKRA